MGAFAQFYKQYRKQCLVEGVNPKQKVQQLKITDPFLTHFIFRYGDAIQWNDIKTADQLKERIARQLIPEFRNRLKPDHPKTVLYDPSNINMARELEVVRQAHPEHYDELKKLVDEDENKAREYIGDTVNKDKKQVLTLWLNKVHSFTDHDPVKTYLVLKPVFDSTTKQDKKTPKPFRLGALKEILKKIQQDPKTSINFNKTYEAALSVDILKENDYKQIEAPGNTVWVHIPGQNQDPKNFDKNVETLMGLSCSIWCVSGKTMAKTYLKNDGSFYLLMDEKHPTALLAIRMTGDTINEIRGEQESQRFDPEKFQEHLLLLIEKENLDRFDVLDWINDQRKHYKLDPIVDDSIAKFQKDTTDWLVSVVRDTVTDKIDEWVEELDPDYSSKIEQLVDEELNVQNPEEAYRIHVESIIDSLNLRFSPNRPIMGYQFNDASDAFEALDDEQGQWWLGTFDGSNYYEQWDTPSVDDDVADQIMSGMFKTVDEMLAALREHNEDLDEETIEDLEAIADSATGPYDFLRDLDRSREGYSDLNLDVNESVADIDRRMSMAFMEGERRGVENYQYEQLNKHIKEEFVVIGQYPHEDPLVFEVDPAEVGDIILDGLLHNMGFVSGVTESAYFDELVKDEYNSFDADTWGADFDVDAAVEGFDNY